MTTSFTYTLNDQDGAEIPVKSPCISICALNSDNLCTGCFRTGDEIGVWGNASNDIRREILALCYSREKKVNPFL